MTLSAGDLAECKEIARTIVKEVMVEHLASCPRISEIERMKLIPRWLIIGIIIGCGGASGGVAFALLKAVSP